MSELEHGINMTDVEADIETLADTQRHLSQFAVVEHIFKRGDEDEV